MYKHSYLTTQQYGQFPIGSRCFAFKIDGGRKLALDFDDGNVIEVPAPSETSITGMAPWSTEDRHELIPLWDQDMKKDPTEETMQEMIIEFRRAEDATSE